MNKLVIYLKLMRLHQPIGIFLLLWPTLMAIWFASSGSPSYGIVAIFVFGTILMRSIGCIINDCADYRFDRYVQRTKNRPLVVGQIRMSEAIILAVILTIIAFFLILPLNILTKKIAFFATIFAISYPYFKRFFFIPQLYLGLTFSFGILMSYSAIQNTIPTMAWVILFANVLWTIAYDTEYAMVDREDDIKLNIKSSAVIFGHYDVLIIMLCYLISLFLFWYVGWQYGLRTWFNCGIFGSFGCVIYYYRLIHQRNVVNCLTAFMRNSLFGALIFLGIFVEYI